MTLTKLCRTVSGMETSGPGAQPFDVGRLGAFLRQHLAGAAGPLRLTPIAGGQSNPTYILDLGVDRYVLRKPPAGPLLPSAHRIDREVRVMRALAGTGVPVPKIVLFHDDPDLLGTPFYLMERVEGRVFHDGALPGLAPAERRAVYLAMAETLARLHAVVPDAVGLGGFGRPGDYFTRQTERWARQWRASPAAGTVPGLGRIADWLGDNLPADDGRIAVVHGDFRLGNLMIHPSEPRVAAVLDWELSTLGHPLADLGFCCLAWHLGPDEYRGIAGLDRAALGLPSQAEFVAHYRSHAPGVAALETVHLVFALFRFAVIFLGIADRARTGNAAGGDAVEVGRLARNCTDRALELIAAGGTCS